jgi:hypothetical protein
MLTTTGNFVWKPVRQFKAKIATVVMFLTLKPAPVPVEDHDRRDPHRRP